MSTATIPARTAASRTACTYVRPAGKPARSEVWLTNTRLGLTVLTPTPKDSLFYSSS
jgi:hypothetical protein